MKHSNLITLYRSLTRQKLHTALNLGGLAVGIAVFIVLGLFVRFETSFEKWLPNHKDIYVVQSNWNLPESPINGAYPETMGGLLDQLREDFPNTIGTRIRGGQEGGSVIGRGTAIREDVAQVDPSFFQVFNLPMVQGDGAAALSQPANALISQEAARKYFGPSDPVGQSITVAVDQPATYRIAGVFRDIPKSSELRFSILVPLPKTAPSENWFNWGSTSLRTFLRFDSPAAAKAFEQKLTAFVDRRAANDMGANASEVLRLSLLPIADLHLQPQGRESSSLKMTVVALGIVGLLTLLIALVNYVNLATARAGLRAREVAMRKVLGADQGALIRQFLLEAILTVALAALLGLILAELVLPFVNAAGGLALSMPYALVIPGLIALVLMAGTVAGFYPAVLLARFPAAEVLASARAPGGGRAGTRSREALVVLQFGLAISFMIGTVVLLAQMQHVRNADLGFNKGSLLVISSLADRQLNDTDRRSVLTAIKELAGVQNLSFASTAAGGSGNDSSDNVPLPGQPGPGPSLRWIATGPDFFDVYGTRLIAGRVFDDQHGSDDASERKEGEPLNIVLNRQAVSTLGFRSPQDAVGKTVGGERPRTIIGVVDNMRFFSPRVPNSATYYIYNREPVADSVASVRFSGDAAAMLAAVRSTWQRIVPEVPFEADTAERKLGGFYVADERAMRLFGGGSALAVLIGCVGLWGLASFNTARRVKEIGIRKTLGASSADILKLLVTQFLRPVLLANLIAWPIAFVAGRRWLAGFDDRIAFSPLFFIGASLLALLIALATVIGQSLLASRAAPAWALRHE